VSALAAHHGAAIVRVHDVAATVAAVRVAAEWAALDRPGRAGDADHRHAPVRPHRP
jgi:hypothetical protein